MRVIRIETPDTSSLGSGMTVALVLCERLMSFPKATKERSRESFCLKLTRSEIPDTSSLSSGMTLFLCVANDLGHSL